MRLNWAVLYGIVWRGWQIAAAPVTLWLIATRFAPETQGFYYTFASLLALQSFFDLGFFIVVVNVAAHEWAHLRLDDGGRIAGDPAARSRLVSLGRLVFRWYAGASTLFFGVVAAVGWAFFSGHAQTGVVWAAPWIALVLVSALNLWAAPFTALLEGCDQVAQVHQVALAQAVLSSVAGWAVILAGGGLWTAPAMAATQLLCTLYLFAVRYRRFFGVFLAPPEGATISWREEVWPMQWRLAGSGLVNYLAYSLFNPVMFHYHGATVAGQMGMTLQIVNGIQSAAIVWIKAKTPALGGLVARRDFPGLDRVWRRAALASVGTYVALGSVFYALLTAMHWQGIDFTGRILPAQLVAVSLLCGVLMNVSLALTAYLRAHKEEPIMVMSVVTSCLIGLLVWLLGRSFGPAGAVWGYLAVLVLIVVWELDIWRRFRRVRHAGPAGGAHPVPGDPAEVLHAG